MKLVHKRKLLAMLTGKPPAGGGGGTPAPAPVAAGIGADQAQGRAQLTAGARGSEPVSEQPRRRIYAFFAKHKDDTINVHGEAHRVMEDLQASPGRSLECNCFPLTT